MLKISHKKIAKQNKSFQLIKHFLKDLETNLFFPYNRTSVLNTDNTNFQAIILRIIF